MTSERSTNTQATTPERTNFLNARIDIEVLLYVILIALAVVSRFYDLGARVMSHDETTHVYFSWLLSEGQGYQHDPLSHGPFQFHMIALSYFLFGDNDASARFPAAIFGVIAVGLLWLFRRWLGRKGAFVAGILMLISPYMLYYSRYARNEALVVPLILLTVWAVFRYLETHQSRWLYLLAFVSSLHFATKETSFIFTAILLLYLVLVFAFKMMRTSWPTSTLRWIFLVGVAVALIGAGVGFQSYFQGRTYEVGSVPDPSEPLEVDQPPEESSGPSGTILIAGLITAVGLGVIATSLILAFGRRLQTDFPSLDLLILMTCMVLPQLSALPATIIGWNPLDYTNPMNWNKTLTTVIVLTAVSVLLGLLWNWRKWLIAAGLFAAPYILLYTTIFTNGQGLATGLVASLGYWLVQQGVERGSQPLYYYTLIQIPIYEFLPVLAATLAGIVGLVKWRPRPDETQEATTEPQERNARQLLLLFLGYCGVASLVTYSYAGERMPWLTVHITLPFILLAGWGIGAFLDSIDWKRLRENRGIAVAVLMILLTLSSLRAIMAILGENPPFQGNEIQQLSATLSFFTAVVFVLATGFALVKVAEGWKPISLAKLAGLIILAILTLITARTGARAAYVNYDEATEFLVYAHMARGPKTIYEQIEVLSERLATDPDFKIAYDNESTYPFWWYLRGNDRAVYFGASPSRDLMNYAMILVGDANWAKIEPLTRDAFYAFDYTRIWWPNQDYFRWNRSSIESERNNELRSQGIEEIPPMGLGEYLLRFWRHINVFILDPEYRHAAWEIWFNRDFTAYGELTGTDFSLPRWSPSSKMRLYVRKDVAARVWDFGVAQPTVELEEFVDPYESNMQLLQPDQSFGFVGTQPGSYSQPRDIAVASDGSLFIADTMNHRIQHVRPDGEVIETWGSFGSSEQGTGTEGTFNEPWGLGIAPDGTIYVADTWNHRIQHFTADGEFLDMFGTFGQGETPFAYWGPRDVAVDANGRLFVADTGNKRIVIFDPEGNYLTEFGGFGLESGYLDEPVGIALDEQDRLFVVDTWNQRVQIFEEVSGAFFESVAEWPVAGWYGQSLENKPYIALGPGSLVCVTDPEGPRVLCFDQAGDFQLGWGSSVDAGMFFGNLTGLAIDQQCGVWVTDSTNSRIMRFTLDLCEP